MLRAWLPAAAYAALIFYLSSKPDLSPPVRMDHADKAAHFLEYGVLGLLLLRGAWVQWHGRSRRLVVAFPLVAGAILAAADEIFQGTVGRQRSAADWGADVAGLLVAVLVGVRVASRSRFRTGKRGIAAADPAAAPASAETKGGSR